MAKSKMNKVSATKAKSQQNTSATEHNLKEEKAYGGKEYKEHAEKEHTEKAPAGKKDQAEKMNGHSLADHKVSFTFNSDDGSVLSKVNANGKTLDISKATFSTTTGTNDLGTTAVVSVTETKTLTDAIKTATYTDQDGDGSYVETFDLTVASLVNSKQPTHQFTFNTDGTIATDTINLRNTTKAETLDSNEVYQQVVLGADTYVSKTTSTTDGNFVFQLFRDDNTDGTWTEIACGHSSGTNIDTTANTVTLAGIQTFLATSESLIG